MDRRQFLQTAAIGTLMAAKSPHAVAEPAPTEQRPLRLRYAINIGTHFRTHPILERLQLVAREGFTAVEFNPLMEFGQQGNDSDWNESKLQVYGDLLRNLKLTQGTWSTNPCAGRCDCSLTDPSQHPEFLRRVERSARLAPLVDGTVSTVTSGIELAGVPAETMTHSVIEGLKRAADIVEKAGGPILVLEPLNVLVNHPGIHVVRSEHAAKIIDAVGSDKVRILFDIYHQQISEGNLIGNIRQYFDKIGYFQFGDHPGRHEPFTGEIYYPQVFQTIHDLGYQGMLGGEYSPAGGGSDEASRASLAAIRRADLLMSAPTAS